MHEPFLVLIPLLNPNEPDALVVGLNVSEGQFVKPGDVLCTLETTKSATEVTAEVAGFVVGLKLSQGQTTHAGEVFCYLAQDPAWKPEPEPSNIPISTNELPPGLRISQPALALARQSGFDLRLLPIGPLVTESLVRKKMAEVALSGQVDAIPDFTSPVSNFDPNAIIVYGGGGHGKSLIDLLRTLGTYNIVGVVDDGLNSAEKIMGLSVLGGGDVLVDLYKKGICQAVNAVGGIGNIGIRIQVFQRLAQAGFTCPTVVHPSAFIEPSAILAKGVQVFPHAYIGSQAQIGFGVIVNTGAIVSHDCLVEDYANLSPGAILAGEVRVGVGVLVGMGATINLRTSLGKGARIGNGATVKSDVPEGGVVRAGSTWPVGN